jgi:ATP-binding cassette subfamily F protein 3
MALVSVSSGTLVLGGKALLRDDSVQIEDGDRIGLIGPNGSGKSTLMKLVAGRYELDEGQFSLRRDLRVAYLSQDLEGTGDAPLLEYVRNSVPGRSDLESQVAKLEHEIARESNSDELQMELATELSDLHGRLAHFDTLYADHVALDILSGLGFSPAHRDRSLGEFSGGWRMRATLASLLFMQPDLLLLDEPTNHLDLPSVAWFSSFLRRYQRAFVLISHDAEFLNGQISRVVSFEPEGLRSYPGNYESYKVKRAEEQAIRVNRARNVAQEKQKAQEFIDRFRYKSSKAKAVQSRIKSLERMDDTELLAEHQTVRFKFPPTVKTSKQVLRVRDLAKNYGDLKVFSGVDLGVNRGQRIGVIGTNGAGKTTLLRVLGRELEPTQGEMLLGQHVELGYYAQHHAETLSGDLSVLDEVSSAVENANVLELRKLLGSLLFAGDDVDKPIRVLSGGERARVALAKLLTSSSNFMLMDEPTNHLDLQSSERLADSLREYDGTLIFVSHNLGFVRQVATDIWNVADGRVESYPGTLDEYMESTTRQLGLATDGGQVSSPNSVRKPPSGERVDKKELRRRRAEEQKRQKAILGPLEKKVSELEKRISDLEGEQEGRNALLADSEVYGDPERGPGLMRDYQEAQDKLENLTARWESSATELEDARAGIASHDTSS